MCFPTLNALREHRRWELSVHLDLSDTFMQTKIQDLFHQVTQITCGIVAALVFLLFLLRACLSERKNSTSAL